MAFVKLMRANVGIWAAYPEAFANPATPTAAELNSWFAYSPAGSQNNMVFNISCAILDDYTLNMSDSDTDDSLSICDIGNVSSPTFQNYEASLNFFRDKDTGAQGVFNMARDLFLAPDLPFWLVKRIGYANTAAFAAGQIISMYGVNTDIPIDVVEDGSMLQQGARFKPNGQLLTNYTIAS